MEDLLARLRRLEALASEIAAEVLDACGLRGVDEHVLVGVLTSTGRVQRCVEALQIEAVGETAERSEAPTVEGRMTHRFGCRGVTELVQRATLVAPASASRLVKAAKGIHRARSLTTGELLEAELPAVRSAVRDGMLGLDGVIAISAPLSAMGSRVSREALLMADEVLAAEARGAGPGAAPPACAELLRIQAQTWAIALDPDGAEPRERLTLHKRALALGVPTPSGIPIRGILMPEVATQLQRIFDATLNPRADGAARFTDGDDASIIPVDTRTRAQKQHDALATALTVAASSGLLPTVGGAAPTLVVHVREEDAVTGRGYAALGGSDAPVTVAAALHTACTGAVQRITLTHEGRIVRLGSPERVFHKHQRRAIALRDGGCVIPGCGISAGWCEIHHVTEHAHGGPTHPDNGVLLCWYHHRFLDRSGWSIRMNRGIPEVRAPGWCDPTRRWQPATTSRTRLLDAVLRQ